MAVVDLGEKNDRAFLKIDVNDRYPYVTEQMHKYCHNNWQVEWFSVRMVTFEVSGLMVQTITISRTRKSSCVNARGIPTAAYQVLHLLSCMMWGTPRPGLMGGYPRWGNPHQSTFPCQATPPPPGQVWLVGGGTPPTRSNRGGTWGGVPPRQGYPPSYLAGVPPLGVNRLKTLPSLVLRTRSVTICPLNKEDRWFLHRWFPF